MSFSSGDVRGAGTRDELLRTSAWEASILDTCNMQDTGNAKDGHPQIFDFYVKKLDLANLFDYFHSTIVFYLVLFV